MAAAARRAMGKRAEVGTDTVAAWKRVASRREKSAAKQAEAKTRATARFEADEGDIATAIDVDDETKRDAAAPKRRRPVRADAEPEPEADAGDYTSRLLAAKRRARGGGDGEADQESS